VVDRIRETQGSQGQIMHGRGLRQLQTSLFNLWICSLLARQRTVAGRNAAQLPPMDDLYLELSVQGSGRRVER